MIFEAISSGHRVDIMKFGDYAMGTAKLYVELYSWLPMISALFPIGIEEAAEARDKHFQLYRTNLARKF